MASKKVGTLIKEARNGADMTQEQLARKISGLSASDISLAEHGQKDLTQAQLKQIAKITGVTQASLLNAAKGSSSAKSTAKKTTTTKKTTPAKKTGTASKSSMQVTAAEKKLVELYREADPQERAQRAQGRRGLFHRFRSGKHPRRRAGYAGEPVKKIICPPNLLL